MTAALERMLRRDRAVVGAALALLAALAWTYLMMTARMMGDMGLHGMTAAFLFAMWAIMMVGMMTPSAAPMILLYARVGRQAAQQGQPFAATGWFASGYLAAWIAFAALATAAHWALARAGLLDPMTGTAGAAVGAIALIAAGLYQWTPLKDACLRQCRAPLDFIMRHGGFRPAPGAALALGLRHGAYCIGCCWALMALLFAVGVMNLAWVAAIAAFVLLEKLVPAGRMVSRVAGAGFVAAGVWVLAGG